MLLLTITSCNKKKEKEKVFGNSYEALLIHPDINFGDDSDSVETVLGKDNPDSHKGEGRSELSYFPGEVLTLPHYIFKIDFSFWTNEKEEFMNNTKLGFITYTINDMIKYEDRTEEKHGDISTEYDTIKSFLSETYGEPFLEEDGASYEKRCFWESEDSKIGIVLTLVHTTSSSYDGVIKLKYSDITRLKSPWYGK